MYSKITRTEAKERGFKRYYSGIPCAAGHDDERRVSNGHCVPCAQAKTKAWAETNYERQRSHRAAYAERNPAAGAKTYAKHSEAEKARVKQWSLNNPERRAEYRARWEANNIGYRRANSARRRAAIRQATPPWLTREQKQQIAKVYETRPNGWEVDHVFPLRGRNVCGLHVPWNLQHLPALVNGRKSNHID